jgi:hypothetical protein
MTPVAHDLGVNVDEEPSHHFAVSQLLESFWHLREWGCSVHGLEILLCVVSGMSRYD